jgi:hypothetical protein
MASREDSEKDRDVSFVFASQRVSNRRGECFGAKVDLSLKFNSKKVLICFSLNLHQTRFYLNLRAAHCPSDDDLSKEHSALYLYL